MMTISDYFLYSLIGMLVVFFALFLLMIMVKLMTKIIPANSAENVVDNDKIQKNAVVNSRCVNIYDTNPRDAAIIMAIVADNLEIPVNQLNFLSIKEVKK